MKIPVSFKGRCHYPRKPCCPVCKEAKVFEPHSMAILSLGARALCANNQAFMSLAWHGAHDDGEGEDREIGCSLDVLKKVGSEQAEMYFCSTACMRKFFNDCMDKLEEKIDECKEEMEPLTKG